jgi:hypothetical protein
MPFPTLPAGPAKIGAFIALMLLAGAALSGCGVRAPNVARTGARPMVRPAIGNAMAEAGYLPPPQLVSVSRSPTALTLTGRAAPNAQVELTAWEGDDLNASASRTGAWRLMLPAVTRPRMFALAAKLDGRGASDRLVHSEGALILLPPSGPPALLVRAGAGAEVFAAPTVRPALDALDYDPSGFSAAAGRARPGAMVRLIMDGALAGAGQADAGGRYSILAANSRLAFGAHTALVQSADGQADRRFTISPPGPTLTTPYQVDPTPAGWRLEWAIPGGGVQITLVFTPAGLA